MKGFEVSLILCDADGGDLNAEDMVNFFDELARLAEAHNLTMMAFGEPAEDSPEEQDG